MLENTFENLQTNIAQLYQSTVRRLSFNKKQQAQLLGTMTKPLRVGRPPVEVARHLAQFGSKQEKIIAGDILDNLRSGRGIVDALEGWYDDVTLSALRAAEHAGPNTFVEAIEYLSKNMLKSSKAKSAVLSKWAYPGVFVLASSFMIFWLSGFLLPTLVAMNQGQIPEGAQHFVSVANFYKYWFPWIVVLLVAGLFYARWWLANHVGPIRDTFDHIPLFSGYRLSIGANVVATFALLKRFDMKPFHIIRLLGDTGSPYQQSHVYNMKEALRGVGKETQEGTKGIVNALDIGLLDDEYVSLVKLYAEADDAYIIEALEQAAEDIGERVMARLSKIAMIGTFFLWGWVLYNVIAVVSVVMGARP
ncbi:type II secretion system F family protein [Marinimicrobium sp. ABcell2]|uniref:type II secretion system F family protein n=1 Tax=Marinimicrobium sp. ABcell2 TaxID=3069751 RepID=UPI0027B16311|nr:type II secretion system F family protein [Marinimicrobium sp. ABcell2]MDQ2077385.1 type II secretion system F family protein [Marinimicrobium sp. ABcell2]